MTPDSAIPRATLGRPHWRARLVRWVERQLEPPRSLRDKSVVSAACSWSITGGIAASGALCVYVLVASGLLWSADFSLTLGWAVFAGMGVIALFWPFFVSMCLYGIVTAVVGGRTRAAGAVFGAAFHVTAHALVMMWLAHDPVSVAILAPAVVGALWGSWLPAVFAPARTT